MNVNIALIYEVVINYSTYMYNLIKGFNTIIKLHKCRTNRQMCTTN